MTRALLALLAVANVIFFAWSRSWLDDIVGLRAQPEREPERLLRQVRPEALRIVQPPAAAAPEPAPAPRAAPGTSGNADPSAAAAAIAALPPACLQAGPFALEDLAAAEAALRHAVPELRDEQLGRGRLEVAGGWAVYVGRFPTAEALSRKQDELSRLRVSAEPLLDAGAELSPGLTLGRYERRGDADAALAAFVQRGVHSARVAAVPVPPADVLRVERADATQQIQLVGLAEPALKGHRFSPCP